MTEINFKRSLFGYTKSSVYKYITELNREFSRKVEEVNAANQDLTQRCSELESEAELAGSKETELLDEISGYIREQDRLRAELQEQQRENEELRAKLSGQLQEQQRENEKLGAKLSGQLQEQQRENEELKAKLSEQLQELERTKAELSQNHKELSELRSINGAYMSAQNDIADYIIDAKQFANSLKKKAEHEYEEKSAQNTAKLISEKNRLSGYIRSLDELCGTVRKVCDQFSTEIGKKKEQLEDIRSEMDGSCD